jgi:hypothetical protein
MLFYNQFLWPIQLAIEAHNSKETSRETLRRWDRKTPYAMHPVWCAMTLLSETSLPQNIRDVGYIVLCLHDLVEDTTVGLPDWVYPNCAELIQEMTFASSEAEFEKLWERSDECKLFKLYDKTSNLMDGSWMSDEKWNKYCDLVHKLIEFVEREYGKLNIVKIARAIAVRRL